MQTTPTDARLPILVTGTDKHLFREAVARMATKKQSQAAKKNVRKAAKAAKSKRSIAHMSEETRTALGKQGAAVAKRKQTGAAAPKTRNELYEVAKRQGLPGRSKMGRDELAKALGHN